jgi:6-phosphofructokinase 1
VTDRVGILTGGGDCPGLNGVIRAVTLHARQLGWEVVGIRHGFQGLYEADYVDLTAVSVHGVLGRGGTILGSSNRANPFAYPLKHPDGSHEVRDVSATCLANLAKLDLQGLVVVGGDGTLAFAERFIQLGAPRIVGVPKTIDNDLEATEYTVGFQSSVEVVVEAIERLHTTGESHDRIMVVEVMGRYAGWIALTAGLAGGAHAVLIPEIEFDPQRIVDAIQRRHARGASYSVVVVAEGAKPAGGAQTVAVAGDATREEKLGGIGAKLCEMISARCDYEVRSTVLGHIQRGAAPCAFDRELATRFGVTAVDMIASGTFGQLAAMYHGHVVTKPLVSLRKRVDPAGELVRTARAVGIELGA